MKKALLAGAASLALAAMPALGVFAETPTNGTHDVTVGEVDQTVYEVDITWGDMTFDWKYDLYTNSFNFKPGTTNECFSAGPASDVENRDQRLYTLQKENNLFSDDTCSTLAGDGNPYTLEQLSEGVTYYYKGHSNRFSITDYTQNGRVSVSASFTPEDKYNWVNGKIGHYGAPCEGQETTDGSDCSAEVLTNGFIPAIKVRDGVSYPAYLSELYLEKTSDPANPELITTADKIGTVTINIADGTN